MLIEQQKTLLQVEWLVYLFEHELRAGKRIVSHYVTPKIAAFTDFPADFLKL